MQTPGALVKGISIFLFTLLMLLTVGTRDGRKRTGIIFFNFKISKYSQTVLFITPENILTKLYRKMR